MTYTHSQLKDMVNHALDVKETNWTLYWLFVRVCASEGRMVPMQVEQWMEVIRDSS